MTATEMPGLADMQGSIKVIRDNADRIFLWDYDRSREQLVTLYNKAMSSQWNSVTDLDWSTDVDPEELVASSPQQNLTVRLARAAAEEPGSPIANWSDKEFTELGIESLKAMLSQFMHGEQGAMMVAAKIVETVPWIDAKYYASTQTMDEARHTEVFAKYLHTKLGDAYPMGPFLEAQIDRPDNRQPLGHRLPRHADRDREPCSGCLRVHAACYRGAAPQQAVALRHVR